MEIRITRLSSEYIAPLSGNNPDKLIIFIHGYGADGADLLGLSREFAEEFPNAGFYSPNAPQKCDMSPFGYQWFPLYDRSEEQMLIGLSDAALSLNAFIAELLDKHSGLTKADIILIGFSQGTMTALHTSLRSQDAFAAIVGFSGALIAGDRLKSEIKSRPPVCLIHGSADQVVPFHAMQIAESFLMENGVEVETHARPNLGHGIDPEGIYIATTFLKKVL